MSIKQSALEDRIVDLDNIAEEDEMNEIHDAIDAMHQSISAKAIIDLRRGSIPKYMKTVAYGSHIAYCFESDDSAEVIAALEANIFGSHLSQMWENMKARFANMRSRVATSVTAAAALASSSLLHGMYTVHRLNKLNAARKYFEEAEGSGPFAKTRLVVQRRTGGKRIALTAFSSDVDDFAKHGKMRNLIKNAERRLERRHMNHARMTWRIFQYATVIWVAAYAGGKLTRNTPAALDAMTKVDLPSNEEEFQKYMMKIAAIMNTQTHFRLDISSEDGAGANIKRTAEQAKKPSIDPTKIAEYLKDRHDAMKRFQTLPDKLSDLVHKATLSNNIWELKGATFTAGMCRAIVYECTNPTGVIDRALAKMDALMDRFNNTAE